MTESAVFFAHERITETPELPVEAYREQITDLVEENQITIISAKTGAGKSTRVPRFLFDTGKYNRIFMTQPRIMAARNVSNRIIDEMNADGLPGNVLTGYQTAHEGNITEETNVNVVTDGLLLMKMLDEGQITEHDVVVIDEFHERNTNMDVVLALCIEKGIKVVIMSATIDVDRLSQHCENIVGTDNVGSIDIPGVVFDVEEHTTPEDRERTMSATIVQAAKRGENVLAFVPGRREAQLLEALLRKQLGGGGALILQLNGDQTPEQQQLAIDSYDRGKIVISTPVGQTSITIPDIDTVVDCGWGRIGEYLKGVHGVPVQSCSSASLDQRRGRVGRVKPGKYYQARLDKGPAFPRIDAEGDDQYDIPEILRTDISDVTLRLANAGFRLAALEGLFDKPKDGETARVERRLLKLGAFAIGAADSEYTITNEGRGMIKYPLDATYGRMIVEAEKHSPELHLQSIAMAAAMQVNGIVSTSPDNNGWSGLVKQENRSDLVVQLKVFYEALIATEEERVSYGVYEQRFQKAKKYYESIAKAAELDPLNLKYPSDEQVEKLIDCIIVSSEDVFVRSSEKYRGATGSARKPSGSSVVRPEYATIATGKPIDIGKMTKNGPEKDRLVVDLTAVNIERLASVLPSHRVDRKVVGHDIVKGKVVERHQISIDGRTMPQTLRGEVSMRSKDAVETGLTAIFERFRSVEGMELASNIEKSQIRELRAAIDELVELQHRTDEDLAIDRKIREIIEDVVERHHGLYDDDASVSNIAKLIPEILSVADIVSETKRRELVDGAPVHIELHGTQVEVSYHNNVAHIDATTETILAVTDEDMDSLEAQLNNRELRFRANNLPGAGKRYFTIIDAQERYSRRSRSERRGPVAPRTIDIERENMKHLTALKLAQGESGTFYRRPVNA